MQLHAGLRVAVGIRLTALVLAAVCLSACWEEGGERREEDRETVVLLHGMGRSRASLWVLGKRLRDAGYETLDFPYVPHWKMDQLSDSLLRYIRRNVRTPKYHLIGHSLGNVIIRNAFKKGYSPGLGRIVMLAPPNRPAELAQSLKGNFAYRLLTGNSGQNLASEAFYATLPVPSVEFGVIAGDRGQSVTFNTPNDGIVQVESTKLEGMKDWVVVHHTHTFMMNGPDTAELCINFLRHGCFHPGAL